MPAVNKQAVDFANKWKDRGDEKQDSQNFWRELLSKVFGIQDPENRIEFEKRVSLKNTSYIDAYIPETQVIIEQKSLDIDLEKAKRQSDGTMLTPFEQAKRYNDDLLHFEKARWIVVCNFQSFLIYDMNCYHNVKPVRIELSELGTRYNELKFLVKVQHQQIIHEQEISIKAGELIGKIYNSLLSLYEKPNSENLKSINKLCVRLVFCLYAEDAGLFDPDNNNIFGEYIEQFEPSEINTKLQELFEILDQKNENRYKYLDIRLKSFPYVNGGLFHYESPETEEIPVFTAELKQLIVEQCSKSFDWSRISPTIFGALFESTLNPESRRSGGMHYTSVENIHKVIDPLFLDSLYTEYNVLYQDYKSKYKESDIKGQKKHVSYLNSFINKCNALQDKIASLNFLDPACGSGNFLTETYICLRRLENQIIQLKLQNKSLLELENNNPVKVSINQFYGIEINDFAVSVATTALWIAESQMLHETEIIIKREIDFLPLSSNTNICHGNALRIDWNTVVPKEKLNYIMGNPPFIGYVYQTKEQKEDLKCVGLKVNSIDYVSGWFWQSCKYVNGTDVMVAFVSTNSITQGEQVVNVWKNLYDNYPINIDFAYRTFIWNSEASDKAHVHCVIIGFSLGRNNHSKRIFDNDRVIFTDKINPYIQNAETHFIERRAAPLFDVPKVGRGNQPTDNGNFLLNEEEFNKFKKENPKFIHLVKTYLGSKEFINGGKRYCFWLHKIPPREFKDCKYILGRLNNIREFRLKSTKEATRRKADTPTIFDEIHQPNSNYIAIPETSSERRYYLPIAFLTPDTICSNGLRLMPNANLYHFSILNSIVHNSWIRAIAGRLKSDYRYSIDIVYNNFIWPDVTESQKEKISKTAQAILDARDLYPNSSLADLYDPLTMPPELLKAHKANDKAVMALYGFKPDATEEEIVAKLMQMYSDKVKELGNENSKNISKSKYRKSGS